MSKGKHRKQVAAIQNKSHTAPDDNSAKQRENKWDGNVRISAPVIIEPTPDLREQSSADRKQQTSHNNKQFIVSVATLAAVIIYAGITAWQASETRKANQISKESLVAVQGSFMHLDGFQVTRHTPARDPITALPVDGFLMFPRFNNSGATQAIDGAYWVNE